MILLKMYVTFGQHEVYKKLWRLPNVFIVKENLFGQYRWSGISSLYLHMVFFLNQYVKKYENNLYLENGAVK